MKLARLEFKMPPLLTDAEIEEVLDVLPDLTKWANEITAYATEAAIHHGKEWNGFKVVEGRSNRKYCDELLVAEAAREHGYTDIYRQTLIPMTEMQKLMENLLLRKFSVTSFINHRASRYWYQIQTSVRL